MRSKRDRWLAQRAGTRQWLHSDLPIFGQPVDELSGAGSLTFDVKPEQAGLKGADGLPVFDSWGTILHLEQAGQIRWSGLVCDSGWDGPVWSVEAAGVSSYPHEQPFDAVFEAIEMDPADIWRAIWAHLQGYPDGNLGVTISGSTSARVGRPPEQVEFEADGEAVAFEAGPYHLRWWDNPDCGKELQQLADEAPFEWVEESRWNADKSDVVLTIRLADRIGRRADDLRFVQGENLDVVPFDQDGDSYASEVVLLGRGEGKAALRSRVATQVPGRLRRARLVDSTKDVSDQKRLDALARAEHKRRSRRLSTAQVVVRNTSHAPFGTFGPGDEILIQANAEWLGKVGAWQRIVARQRLSPTTMLLDLEPTTEG